MRSCQVTGLTVILKPAPRAEAVLFSLVERGFGGGGKAASECLLVVGKLGPCFQPPITSRAGVRDESFVIIAAYHIRNLTT
jgi:hypothetical protein